MEDIKLYKVIAINNSDRDYIDDKLIEDNLIETKANIIASKMNAESEDYSEWYYKVVPNNYKLYKMIWPD